ncbi:hypothetical protein [Methylocella sp.]|uniref:hypothetical protein n=1 Tax=Methylocella sp. TaxID=1978226 RepID=UPI003784EA8F
MTSALEPDAPPFSLAEAGRAGAPSHPEEMKAHVALRIGDRVALNASARLTPAGLVCGAIAVSAALLSAAALVRAARGAKAR